MVEEARLEQLDAGLTPVTEGWFVVSIPDAAWVTNEALGATCIFEGEDVSFPDIGYTLAVPAAGTVEPVSPRSEPGGLSSPRRRVPAEELDRAALG
jgi:hypothetical protein